MAGFRFIHAADLHLDSPLRGLERYEGAPVAEARLATRRALENLVQLALDEGAALVCLAGDLYDGDWRDYNTGLFFTGQMRRLAEAGIRVAAVSGNHDALGRLTKGLPLPENVIWLPVERPGTLVIEELGLAVHGQGFARPEVREDLSAAYPPARPGYFNLGLLHTALTGRPGHEPYSPCAPEGLKAKGYDYWALGHVHQWEKVSESPWVVFSGCAQGRHVRETGPKGCALVTVEDGRVVSVEHRPLDVLRWEVERMNGREIASPDDLLFRAAELVRSLVQRAEGRLVALRLEVVGPSPAHAALAREPEKWINALRAEAAGAAGESLWLEKISFRTAPEADLEALKSRDDALGHLLGRIDRLGQNQAELTDLGRELADLRQKLPEELRTGPDPLDLESPAALKDLVAAARDLLVTRLLEDQE